MRILLTRTDRVGDVVLSTPAIKAMRDKYPDAYIAFMVRPYAYDIVAGNPYLDEVLIYDKYGKQKNLINTIKFAINLKKKKFDLAVMLHPTNRVHFMAYLAGIPERVGYDKKLEFLLTKKIPHLKQQGEKHELEYTLDLLQSIGVDAQDKTPFISIQDKACENIEKILDEHHVGKDIMLIAINPGASCPSKRWSSGNFAVMCDSLAEKFKGKIILISDEKNAGFSHNVANGMKYEPIDLAGKTSIGELAALLSKCKIFISNDSGPVHIACAVGIPVISIFGRSDPGLSPKRWKPWSENSVTFHKEVGCGTCLAHNCKIGFKCLEAITPAEVLNAAEKLLK